MRVNPRGCGETASEVTLMSTDSGQSPRVRGNPWRSRADGPGRGSIPAGAGKPSDHQAGRPHHGVNPRGCGETAIDTTRAKPFVGQSPRVRGNPWRSRADGPGRGSIPAGAGKPRPSTRGRRVAGVNPRGCGETVVVLASVIGEQGQSPRVRGNLRWHTPSPCRSRSIPAGAGKPREPCPGGA